MPSESRMNEYLVLYCVASIKKQVSCSEICTISSEFPSFIKSKSLVAKTFSIHTKKHCDTCRKFHHGNPLTIIALNLCPFSPEICIRCHSEFLSM